MKKHELEWELERCRFLMGRMDDKLRLVGTSLELPSKENGFRFVFLASPGLDEKEIADALRPEIEALRDLARSLAEENYPVTSDSQWERCGDTYRLVVGDAVALVSSDRESWDFRIRFADGNFISREFGTKEVAMSEAVKFLRRIRRPF